MPLSQVITIISVTAAVFAVTMIGASARSLGWVSREADAGLLKLIIRVLMPCFIFQKVVGNPAFSDASNIYMPPLWGFLAVAVGCLVAYLAAKGTGKTLGFDTPDKVNAFAVCIGIFNYGFIPIPLVQQIFGERALGVLFLHNVGVELGIWTIGVSLASGGLTKGWWKNVLNPPSISIIISLSINGTGLAPFVPEFLDQIVGILAAAAIPMMMLLIGATFYDQLLHVRVADDPSSPWPVYISSVVLRLGALPVVFLALALWLPISLELKQVVAIQAAMPSAMFPVVLTRHYGGDQRVAFRTVIATTLVGFVTIPLWISVGIAWLGLETTVLPQTSREAIVLPQLESVEPFKVAGISVRTRTLYEQNQDTARIPGLYERFQADVIDQLISQPVRPQQQIAVYADYESNQSGEFTILLGKQVDTEAQVPDQLESVRIDGGKYLHFVGEGSDRAQAVQATWERVWQYFEEDMTYTRAYDTDFEIHDQASPGKVELFISVR